MCGIVGYVGNKHVVDVIVEGLRRLEYRGYDSAGLAVARNGKIEIRRASGKLRNLEEAIRLDPLDGSYGVGHTRWATHGRPTEENAHPHRDSSGKIVVVHNGIIENYLQLKRELQREDCQFVTETDTEAIAQLIGKFARSEPSLEAAVRKAVKQLKGIFAIAVISADEPDKIVAVRQGPPVVIGLGNDEYFVASDIPAVLYHTRDFIFLGDGEVAVLTREGVTVTDFDANPIAPMRQRITWDPIMAEKGGFKHFMLKEIYEQPRAVRETMQNRFSLETGCIYLDDMDISEEELRAFTSLKIAACGTSWHAALVGKYMLEELVRIPVEVDYASEFRYRNPILDEKTLVMVITQSGETADTLAALRQAKEAGCKVLAICNVNGSMVTREAHGTILTHAGPEIGVASTKAFTAQMTALYLFALYLAQVRNLLSAEKRYKYICDMIELPVKIESLLSHDDAIEDLAKEFFRSTDFLYLGRGINFPIALEGALKLKEISYIHAEGYPAGEMKHGPNALIDGQLPVVFVAPYEPGNPASQLRHEKTLSNITEVKARDGKVISVITEGDTETSELSDYVIEIPPTTDLLSPILSVVPLQLLAYHIAVRRGCDVDQPRNLAKSVTVE
ncbi:MAG: glutamine--fructose-6-phosphate transaminase (isomerizing) [Acidobacteriota bacterium]|nr:glutamine--fructose-6-phosphate transaminase (isomerizing) [Blastocatellia bacterium]MDW8412499.1 glutamine--fructose-6-phosphate transaminase (isomerizing) [Acidobacteriota bacterium]